MGRKDHRYFDETYASKESCRKLAKEAEVNKCWINYKKQWFSPDEFIKEASSQKVPNHPGYTLFENDHIKIRDVRALVPRMDAYLNGMVKKRNDLVQKVNEYYDSKLFDNYKTYNEE